MNCDGKNLSLPPFCEGKTCGKIKLIVEKLDSEIILLSFKHIVVNILWWGEEKPTEKLVHVSSKPFIFTEYQIKTNPYLFQAYLYNCEPLIFKLYTTSGEFLGSSKVTIDSQLLAKNCWNKTSRIYCSLKQHIGNLTVTLKTQNMTLKPLKSMKVTNHTEKHKLEYISKKNNSYKYMKKDMKVKSLPSIQNKKKEEENIIYITILNAEVNNFNLLKNLSHYSLNCAVTSKIFKRDKAIRTFSSSLTTTLDDGFQTSFNHEILQRCTLKLPDENRIFINFGFCLQAIDKRSPSIFIGFSRIDLQEAKRNDGLLYKRCPIIDAQKDIAGTIHVKMYLKTQTKLSDGAARYIFTKQLQHEKQKIPTKSHPISNEPRKRKNVPENAELSQTVGSKSAEDQVGKNTGSDSSINNNYFHVDSEEQIKISLPQTFKGLLFIEKLQNVKTRSTFEYFITYEGFWNECQEQTQSSVELVFNYTKEFKVNLDDHFLKKVENNHLELKLWENNNLDEKFMASTRVPLHQFYIALRDPAMIQHLSMNQLPIISIDTYSNFTSPVSSTDFCQVKVLLAIGSESQIENIKKMRNGMATSMKADSNKMSSSEVSASNDVMKNKLTSFLKELSQKMPGLERTSQNDMSKSPPLRLKKTSDLLDTLQVALSQTTQPLMPLRLEVDEKLNNIDRKSDSSLSSFSQDKRIKIVISLEHATHLPKVTKKRQNRRKNKLNLNSAEHEPLTYATFDSGLESLKLDEKFLPNGVIKSHEGFVYSTKVIKSVDPHWNDSFEIQLPLDILTNPQKKFVVKVWRKCTQDCELKPAPFEDAVIGFTAVDLSVLLTGMSVLSGYYNITDFSGRNNGQIKLSFKPAESLIDYQNLAQSLLCTTNLLLNPLNGEEAMSDDVSRTLKRKFNELDEITQRLKARLFDVTGDENYDPDEEFERDLNTSVDEDMNDDNLIDFEWLKKDSDNITCGESFNNYLNIVQPSTSFVESSSIPTQRLFPSGCSSANSQMEKDQLLWKYDLDTVINPNIFKNLLDPSIAGSESTQSLLRNANISRLNSDDTSISSTELVESIENALEQTRISKSERKND